MNRPLEEMSAFFNVRAAGYEQHMRESVECVDEYYGRLAEHITQGKEIRLLDLGCGTGLELDEIFKVNPDVYVTGIDLSENMLALLHAKYAGRKSPPKLICGSYFDVDFGTGIYDIAVSAQTLHHFSHEKKTRLYTKIRQSLKPGGFYLEADYTADSKEEEDLFYTDAENRGSQTDGYYHIDTPCCIETQLRLLRKSGFTGVQCIGRYGKTGLFKAEKAK